MRSVSKFYVLMMLLVVAASVSAQTLLYQWNFDNATGTGASLNISPSHIDRTMTGGTLVNISGVNTVSAPAGSGVYGSVNSSDLGLVYTGVFRNTAGDLGTMAADLSSVSSFTIALWVNFNATVTGYVAGGNTLNSAGNTLLSRLVDISTNGADGSELYFAFNGANVQFGVNKNGTGNVTGSSPLTPLGLTSTTITNTWIFLAAAYTNTAGGTVNFYTGTTTGNATLAGTMTGVGTPAWSSNTNQITIGNAGNTGANRSLPGSIDDVSFYSGMLTLSQIINLQTNIAPTGQLPTAGVPVVLPASMIYLGSSITITSAFSGLAPLSFQWQTDGSGGTLTNIPGATNSTLAATPFKTGSFQYDLIVSNSSGSATSAVALVTVQPLAGTANAIVNVASNLSTVAGSLYGMGTAVYDNQNGNATLPGLLIQSGINTLRYPGGGYADIFHWSVTRSALGSANGSGFSPWFGDTNDYAYIGSQTDFGKFVSLLANARCQAIVTIDYGSGQQWGSPGHTNLIVPGTNAEPPEAAAWVAYANANTNIYGTISDVTLGVDSLGNDWKTAGYWAMMRAASPLGVDDGYNFLRIGRQAPVGIKFWEIGNEQFGTGYYDSGNDDGYSVCYAEPYPYTNFVRYGNSNLSPAFYGKKVNAFSLLMKSVDPTIKIGAVVTTEASWDVYAGQHWMPQVMAQCASNIDFVINHWYPYTGTLDNGGGLLPQVASGLPAMINGTGDHTGLNAGLRDLINAARSDGTNVQIFITEFGYMGSLTNSINGEPIYGPVNGLFSADAYATWMELGVSNVDWLELNKNTFLGDSNPLVPGATYYAVQLTHDMAGVGDKIISAASDVATLRVHAAMRQDGMIGMMLVNENVTNGLTVNLSIPGVNLAGSGTMYQFGTNNFSGSSQTPSSGPSSNSVSGLGNSFSMTVPAYTMVVLTIPVLSNTPPVLAPMADQVVNAGQTVAFPVSATDTNVPVPSLTFTLTTTVTNAALGQISNTNANFVWRPQITQANSTNKFTIIVTASGSPSLGATQSFNIIVKPTSAPGLAGIVKTAGQFSFSINGANGPDYEIQASTDLAQWSNIFTTNSPVMPFTWMDTHATNALARFYRVVIGPPLP